MIIVMLPGASRPQIDHVMDRIQALGYTPHPMFGVERTVIGAIGDERGKTILESLRNFEGVESVIPILKPFKLASRGNEGRIHRSAGGRGAHRRGRFCTDCRTLFCRK